MITGVMTGFFYAGIAPFYDFSVMFLFLSYNLLNQVNRLAGGKRYEKTIVQRTVFRHVKDHLSLYIFVFVLF